MLNVPEPYTEDNKFYTVYILQWKNECRFQFKMISCLQQYLLGFLFVWLVHWLAGFGFFQPRLWHVEVSGPGIQPMPQQWPKPLQWQCQILNPVSHRGIPRNIFLDPSAIVMKIKPKINKWDLVKLKSFCIAKETISKVKRQPTELEKNICKWSDRWGTYFQNTQTALAAQYQKTNNPIKK